MALVTALFGWLFSQSYLNVPNGDAIDLERDPPRFAAPCDRHNRVAINVPGGHLLGDSTISLRYDGEDRTLGPGASSVMIRMKWEF